MGLLGGVGGDKSCTATSLTLPLQRSRQAKPQLCSLSSATAELHPPLQQYSTAPLAGGPKRTLADTGMGLRYVQGSRA